MIPRQQASIGPRWCTGRPKGEWAGVDALPCCDCRSESGGGGGSGRGAVRRRHDCGALFRLHGSFETAAGPLPFHCVEIRDRLCYRLQAPAVMRVHDSSPSPTIWNIVAKPRAAVGALATSKSGVQCHTSQAAPAVGATSGDEQYGESRCRYEYGNDDGRLHQGKGSTRALHPAAGPALYKTGPVDCHRVPTSAPPGRKDGFYLHHDVEDVCRSDRRAVGVGEESTQGARSCDLEGNRAGLGCLEHLRNALSFAVVTEWPVGVYQCYNMPV